MAGYHCKCFTSELLMQHFLKQEICSDICIFFVFIIVNVIVIVNVSTNFSFNGEKFIQRNTDFLKEDITDHELN